MTSAEILKAIVRHRFPPQRYAVCPNVTCVCDGESDLVAVTESGYVHEVEIKVSVSDLRRDHKKYRWRVVPERLRKQVNYYWLAVPEPMTYLAIQRAHEIGQEAP